jgi:hypothetical protein
MSDYAAAFVECDYNRYSLAVLTGILEEDERFENLDLHFLTFKKKARSKHSNAAYMRNKRQNWLNGIENLRWRSLSTPRM